MSIEKSMAEREKIKHRKPAFNREDWHKRRAVSKTSWRKPRGKHSKMRHGFHGHPTLVNPGYGSPSDVRGLHSSGLMPIRVSTTKDLDFLDKKVHAVVIASAVGTKKKVEMVKKASQLGLKILCINNPTEYIKNVEEKFASKKAAKIDAEKAKKEKAKEKETKKAPQQKEEKKEAPAISPETEDDAKKKENKELEKVLTKRAR